MNMGASSYQISSIFVCMAFGRRLQHLVLVMLANASSPATQPNPIKVKRNTDER
jgi:hypothetical protein